MGELPLPVIGWLYTIVSAAALLLGAYLVAALHLQGEAVRGQLAQRTLEDALLFSIWLLGLAGGIGVLLLEPWGRVLLEFSYWVLVVLTLFSAICMLRGEEAIRLLARG